MVNLDIKYKDNKAIIKHEDIRLLHALRSALKHYTEAPVFVPSVINNTSSMYIQSLIKQIELVPLVDTIETANLTVSCVDTPYRHVFMRDVESEYRPWNEDIYLFTLSSGESISISLESKMVLNPPNVGPVGTISSNTLVIESNGLDLKKSFAKIFKTINTHLESMDILKWNRTSTKQYISIETPYTTVGIPYLMVLLRCNNPDIIDTSNHTRKHHDGGIFYIDIVKKDDGVKMNDILNHLKKPAKIEMK